MKKRMFMTIIICLFLTVLTAGICYGKYMSTHKTEFQLDIKANLYKLTFQDASGTVVQETEKTQKGNQQFKIDVENPAKQFFVFGGWNHGETIYQKDEIYSCNTLKDDVLQAVWLYDKENSSQSACNAITQFELKDNKVTIDYTGVDSCEVFSFPMRNLVKNDSYTVSFDFYYEYPLNSGGTRTKVPCYTEGGHRFGYGISQDALNTPEKAHAAETVKLDFVEAVNSTSYSTTMKATADTMYIYICACKIIDGTSVKMHFDNLTLTKN